MYCLDHNSALRKKKARVMAPNLKRLELKEKEEVDFEEVMVKK